MAVTIVKDPKKISWSKNPIVFEFSTDNRFENAGVNYIANLSFTTGGNEGDLMKLRWNFQEFIFEFKDEPNDSGLQLPSKVVGQELHDWLTSIAEVFRSYFLFDSDYKIELDTDKLRIESRKSDSNFNIKPLQLSNGITLSDSQQAITQKLRDNFALYVEILIENQSFTKSIIEVDADNIAIWDIQEYLTSAILQHGNPLPNLESSTVFKENISAKSFKLRYAEMYGYPQQMRRIISSDEYITVLGGTSIEHYESRSLPEFLMDDQINKWVTNSAQKTILTSQQDYASILNFRESFENVSLHVKVYYPDEKLIIQEVSLGPWLHKQKLVIPVGITAISSMLNMDIGEPNSFSLAIKTGGNQITNTINFKINHTYYRYVRTLMFLNSLGCYESIYTYGRAEISYDVEKNEKSLEQKVDRNLYEGSLKEIDIELRDTIKLNSGYRIKHEIYKFRDFILSKSKFIFHEGKFRPVVLDSSSVNETQDGNHLYAISFSVKFSNEQILYS